MYLFIYLAFIALWLYSLGIVLRKKYYCECIEDMKNQTVLITGASEGLGKSSAYAIAGMGARVIMTCRDYKKGEMVMRDIMRKTSNTNIVLHHLDFGNLKTVVKFCKQVNKVEKRVDVLINNAGVGNAVGLTEDKFPTLFASNVLGAFLLTKLLLPVLRNSCARIVFISSVGHYMGKINFESWTREDGSSVVEQFRAYTASKLALVLISKELHRREFTNGITSIALHPGTAFTGIFRTFPTVLKFIAFPIFALFLKNAEEGAQTQIHCAVNQDMDLYSGQYFAECKPVPASQYVDDEELCSKLWEYCNRKVHDFIPKEEKTVNKRVQHDFTSFVETNDRETVLMRRR